jgi:hypothetical protein
VLVAHATVVVPLVDLTAAPAVEIDMTLPDTAPKFAANAGPLDPFGAGELEPEVALGLDPELLPHAATTNALTASAVTESTRRRDPIR